MTIRAAALALSMLLAPLVARAETAVFAGGCFWCVEADFDKVPGVTATVSGYTGGDLPEPTYKQVSAGGTGHYEAVEITFDPSVVSYAELVRLFLRSVDPLDPDGQFCDRGDSYRTAIFAMSDAQRKDALAAVEGAEATLGQKVATPVLRAQTFWPAEEYHQDYYKSGDIVLTRAGPKTKRSAYAFYREACGRDARVKAIWGDEAAFAK
jgi:peptide-methionine (S)-S-oxide reductase